MTATEKLNAKVAALNTETLKDMAGKLMRDTREGTELVLSAVLDALMGRLPEAEFVALCEGLE
jgi:hypothetical protein